MGEKKTGTSKRSKILIRILDNNFIHSTQLAIRYIYRPTACLPMRSTRLPSDIILLVRRAWNPIAAYSNHKSIIINTTFGVQRTQNE